MESTVVSCYAAQSARSRPKTAPHTLSVHDDVRGRVPRLSLISRALGIHLTRSSGHMVITVPEADVKQFNKRVKGTEQFWHAEGVEPILALRSL